MPDYPKKGRELGELVARKQEEYGDSFGRAGEVMRLLYPNGIPPNQMDDALFVVRVLDKLFRIASSTPEERAKWEESPGKDIGGYGILEWLKDETYKT